MKRNKILQIVLFLSIFITGCDNFLTTPPLDVISDSQWWQTKAQVQMMVDGCYTQLYGPDEVINRDCITDNAKYRTGDIIKVGNGTMDTKNSYVKGLWQYNRIAQLNYVLEGIEKAKSFIPDAEYENFKAQVQFIRAFIYYDMLFYFGDIPLITKVLTVSESRETSRQPRVEVLTFILNELESEVLPNIDAVTATGTGRVNKDVVNAYLARIYLHQGNYDKVLYYTNEVMKTGKYALYNNYEGLFRPSSDGNNNEVIFERQYSYPLYVTTINRDLSPVSSVYAGWSRVLPLQNLVDEYQCINGHPISECPGIDEYDKKRVEATTNTHRGEYDFRDPRLQATIMNPFWEWKVGGVVQSVYGVDDPTSKDAIQKETYASGFLITKWVDLNGTYPERTQAQKNLTIIRYADVLLMRAEALIEKNQNLSEAANLLNSIRTRAGMPANIVVSTQAGLREKLRNERRIELAFEGLRYYDIIRWRIAGQVKNGKVYGARLKAVNASMDNKFMEDRYWNDNMYLLPVPQNAIDLNPNLVQNSGY